MNGKKFQQHIYDNEYKKYTKYQLDNWRISYLRRIFYFLEIEEKDNRKGTFLDIGVGGSGYTIIEAARKGYQSIGIDISSEGIGKAHKFSRQNIASAKLCDFLVCSADKLPFRGGTFTKICSVALLEHIEDDDSVISEISRLIVSKGKAIITVPNSYQRIPPFLRFLYRYHDRRVGHFRHYTAEELIIKFFNKKMVFISAIYHANFPKLIQYTLSIFFPWIKKRDSSIWWKLEYLDFKLQRIPTGLHIFMCFERE